MEHKNKRGFNLSLLIITVLIISSLCYLGVIFTSSVEIAKVEENNYLKVEENTLDEKTNRVLIVIQAKQMEPKKHKQSLVMLIYLC